jgi:hypothetical protein
MEKSTPINRLPKNNNSADENALVQDILDEIGNSNSPEDRNAYNKNIMNNKALEYALDEAQMDIPQKINYDNIDEKELNMDLEREIQKRPETFLEKIIKLIKTPLIISFLFFIICLPQVTNIFIKYIPKLGTIDGDINMYGNIFRAILLGVLYLIINLYL